MLNTDYREIENLIPFGELIYTGPIDEFFDFRFGKLPYRSLDFQFETFDRPVFQDAPVVNYPNENPYTRCTEFKYLTGQEHPNTSVVYEYPKADGDPYYPVPRPENAALYRAVSGARRPHAACPFLRPAGHLQVLQHGPGRRAVAGALQTHQRPATHAADRAKCLSMGGGLSAGSARTSQALMRREKQCVPAHPDGLATSWFLNRAPPFPGAARPVFLRASRSR